MHSYDTFHTRFVGPGVKGFIGMHRFNICLVVILLVVVFLWCENTIRQVEGASKVPLCLKDGAIPTIIYKVTAF